MPRVQVRVWVWVQCACVRARIRVRVSERARAQVALVRALVCPSDRPTAPRRAARRPDDMIVRHTDNAHVM